MQTYIVTRTQTIRDPETGRSITIPVAGYLQGPGRRSVVTMLTKLLNNNETLPPDHPRRIENLAGKINSTRHMTQEERRVRKLEDKLFRAEGERATKLAALAQQARFELAHKLQAANVNAARRRAAA